MKSKRIIILDYEESPWPSFIEEYLSDTSALITHSTDFTGAQRALDSVNPDLFFVADSLLSPHLIKRLNIWRETKKDGRLFQVIHRGGESTRVNYDYVFKEPFIYDEFQSVLIGHLPVPETINVLVVDDDEHIGFSIRDYLANREKPTYSVTLAENGVVGLSKLEESKPHVVVMDVKMPKMDGREFYRRVMEKNVNLPVIAHFDAVIGDEVVELNRYGTPAIVEKGGDESHLPRMRELIHKMVYFGGQ